MNKNQSLNILYKSSICKNRWKVLNQVFFANISCMVLYNFDKSNI